MLRFLFLMFFVFASLPVYAVASCKSLLVPTARLSQSEINSLIPLSPDFLKKYGQTLFFDHDSPVSGNEKGQVTLVDFYDYQCAYCKQIARPLENLEGSFPQMRLVYKPLPMFGDESRIAALAVISAGDRFDDLHHRLIAQSNLSESSIRQSAEESYVSASVLKSKKEMAEDELNRNLELMDKLDLTGTPSFVIARVTPSQFQKGEYDTVSAYFISDVLDVSALRELIKQFSQNQC